MVPEHSHAEQALTSAAPEAVRTFAAAASTRAVAVVSSCVAPETVYRFSVTA